MRNLGKLISSQRSLIVFETAARLGSFTKAAEDMGLQQPSVSAAIKQLEADLAVQLFYRSHRRVDLTNAGKRLYADVSRALTDIEHSIQTVRQMGRGDYVTLSTSSAFAYYWMMPKLQDLRERHPFVDLRLQNSDREPDLDAENISLAIRLGRGDWPGYNAELIAEEVIYPVAAPNIMAQLGDSSALTDLLKHRLIHLEEPIRERPTWSQWFAYHGLHGHDVNKGLRLNDYALVLQVALAGEGFAFGWDHIVKDLIAQKMLLGAKNWSWKTGNGIYLVWSKNRPLNAAALHVRDWVLETAALD